jgi:hypothetical protein
MRGLEEWLSSEGAQNIQNVNRCLEAAEPWHSAVGETRAAKSARRKGKGRS